MCCGQALGLQPTQGVLWACSRRRVCCGQALGLQQTQGVLWASIGLAADSRCVVGKHWACSQLQGLRGEHRAHVCKPGGCRVQAQGADPGWKLWACSLPQGWTQVGLGPTQV